VGFYGFLAPAGLPKDVTAKLSDAFKQVMGNPDIRNRMVRRAPTRPLWAARNSRSSWPRKCRAGPPNAVKQKHIRRQDGLSFIPASIRASSADKFLSALAIPVLVRRPPKSHSPVHRARQTGAQNLYTS
jgi:hypothetical protein